MILGLGLAGFIGFLTLRSPSQFKAGLEPVGKLEPFFLRDQEAGRVTVDHFKGKISVVDFIFTRCPGICPLLTQRMSQLEKNTRQFGDKLQFVSISVDPDYDTPLVMMDYIKKQGVKIDRWKFLTGPLNSIEKVVIGSFQTFMGKRKIASESGKPDLFEITHGENFILVDRNLNLRLFHKVQTDQDIQEVYSSVETLIREN